jgi:HTH-type transcriptional regulator/antitoxin HigA
MEILSKNKICDATLIDVISHMITMYDERKNYQIQGIAGVDALRFLMDQHHLTQTDLPEIGSQGVVSEILQNKRKLNVGQIKKLSKKFHVSPNTFIE